MLTPKPEPLVCVSIAPRSSKDFSRLREALEQLAGKGRGFVFELIEGLDQFMLQARDEAAIDAVATELAQWSIPFDVGTPIPAYRERITQTAEIDHTHKKLVPNGGEFARIVVTFEPNTAESENQIIDALPGGIPQPFVQAARGGIAFGLQLGALHGWPLIGVRATIKDCAFHDVDSTEHAFAWCGLAATSKLKHEAAPVLVEPIAALSISAPAECTEVILGDLAARRGHVRNCGRGVIAQISAVAPMSNLFGYSETLAAMSDGQAHAEMVFSHYDAVSAPPDRPFQPSMAMRA